MDIKVALDINEQRTRQHEVWNALISTLPPSPKKTLIRLLIAGGLIAIAIAVFAVIAAGNFETSSTVLAVIILIAGVVTLSGGVFDLIAKKRKSKKLLAHLDIAIDEMYHDAPAATAAMFEWSDTGVTVTLLSDSGDTLRKFAHKLSECAVTSVDDKLAIDFNETDSYCFTEDEVGTDKMIRLKRALLTRHESYRTVDRDERGKYYISGADG